MVYVPSAPPSGPAPPARVPAEYVWTQYASKNTEQVYAFNDYQLAHPPDLAPPLRGQWWIDNWNMNGWPYVLHHSEHDHTLPIPFVYPPIAPQ